MAVDHHADSNRRNSSAQLLQELEELSQSLYQSHPVKSNRRTASFALPRSSADVDETTSSINTSKVEVKSINRGRSRRMSLSAWLSRTKLDDDDDGDDESQVSTKTHETQVSTKTQVKNFEEERVGGSSEKKGIWKWKPIRAISHIGMKKLSCLFSVEVVSVKGLPSSMNGLRLSVCVRKRETKDGSVHTMPSRVSQGAADFDETLFVKCHVHAKQQQQQLRFEPRPFWIYAFAVDAGELDFGRGSVDLSQLIQVSIDKSIEGGRVRQWDTSFNLSGKAKGGELVLKLGFQIMDKDGGIDVYSQAEGLKTKKDINFGRRQSKTSFSVPNPRTWTPSRREATADHHHHLQGIDDLDLDEPALVPSSSASVQRSKEPESKIEDVDLPEFEIVDKGVEIQHRDGADQEGRSVSSEVIKEVVRDQAHMRRLSELDSIAQQIKALESMIGVGKFIREDDETKSQRLDADEETTTREFLQMLEDGDSNGSKFNQLKIPPLEVMEDSSDDETKVYLPDLGKGLGCVIQTRDGGYLAAMNPLDSLLARKDTPKLAMQMSKPFVLISSDHKSSATSGFELYQKMAAQGFEELSSRILSLMSMDELTGKTAEQIAFEGIAAAIIQGRNKEGASSSAARIIAAAKTMANAMSTGREDRISTGIWNVNEKPLVAEEILGFSLQKIETMAVEALKIQADMSEEDAPFDVSPNENSKTGSPLASAVSLDHWIKNHNLTSTTTTSDPATITIAVIVQLRDPIRRYEAVGGHILVLLEAARADMKDSSSKYEEEEKRFKVTSLNMGGVKVRSEGKRSSVWDGEKQKLTAIEWLLEYGVVKASKKKAGKQRVFIKGKDVLWSISSLVMADLWLKPMRNPDIKF